MDWFDRASSELEQELENGNLTQQEFNREMANIRAELREEAADAAEEAYNDAMGY